MQHFLLVEVSWGVIYRNQDHSEGWINNKVKNTIHKGKTNPAVDSQTQWSNKLRYKNQRNIFTSIIRNVNNECK